MKDETITRFISQERLKSYENLEEYKQNLYFSEQYYLLLSVFEISLRNSIDFRLCSEYGNNWLNDNTLPFMQDRRQKQVKKVEEKIRKRGENVTHNKVVAELSFGFWTSLFNDDCSNIMRISDIKKIFPNLPPKKQSNINRKIISKKLNDIRLFRNRVFHYEKVINKPEYNNIREEILKLLCYFDEEIYDFAKNMMQKNA